MSKVIVITDTSVLINFLVLDKVPLLTSLSGSRFVVTEHVRDEVLHHYGEQRSRLERAFDDSLLEEIRVTDLEEVSLFAKLTTIGLGVGECSAIAVAAHRQFTLAIDDKRAAKKVQSFGLQIPIVDTQSLVVALIHDGQLDVEEADVMKHVWEQSYRFRLPFDSFSELV